MKVDAPVVNAHDLAARVLDAVLDRVLLHLALKGKGALERGGEGVALEEGERLDEGGALLCGQGVNRDQDCDVDQKGSR